MIVKHTTGQRSGDRIERVLTIERDGIIKTTIVRLRYPEYVTARKCWQTVLECDAFRQRPFAIYGSDPFQSLILALVALKCETDNLIEAGVTIYLERKGDKCGWRGLHRPRRSRAKQQRSRDR